MISKNWLWNGDGFEYVSRAVDEKIVFFFFHARQQIHILSTGSTGVPKSHLRVASPESKCLMPVAMNASLESALSLSLSLHGNEAETAVVEQNLSVPEHISNTLIATDNLHLDLGLTPTQFAFGTPVPLVGKIWNCYCAWKNLLSFVTALYYIFIVISISK